MRRKDREVLDEKSIEEIIRKSIVCRVGFCDEDSPYVIPMSYGYEHGALYFHSAPEGRKIDLIRRNNKVCFEMDAAVELIEGDLTCRWGMKYASVVGFGKMSVIADDPEQKRKALEIIFRHYSNAPFDVPDDALKRVVILKIEIESMTGKISGG